MSDESNKTKQSKTEIEEEAEFRTTVLLGLDRIEKQNSDAEGHSQEERDKLHGRIDETHGRIGRTNERVAKLETHKEETKNFGSKIQDLELDVEGIQEAPEKRIRRFKLWLSIFGTGGGASIAGYIVAKGGIIEDLLKFISGG